MKITSEAQAYAILEAANKFRLADLSFIDESFPQQASFLHDPATLKAALCPRRAGKSRGIGAWLLEPLFKEPDVTTLYIALTHGSAKDIMWRDVLQVMDRDLCLNLKANETELTLTNKANNSMIKLVGANSGPEEMKKFLGRKIRRVAIDEAADFRQDLEKLVYEILLPALADHNGEIALIGTPGAICKGLFYDVTTGKKPGWSFHTWSSLENPYMRDKILKQIQMLQLQNPRVVETPWYKRNYLGEWVQESSSLCYAYEPARNDIHEYPVGSFTSILGIDLGYNDSTAFTVACYSDSDTNLYFVDCYKKSQMTISDVAERCAYYQKKYNIVRMIVDNASKQAVEELKQRFGLPLEAAEKQGKAEFIEIMNSEFFQGKIKLLQPMMKPLSDEYADLIWDDKASRRQEHPACENHVSDSSLYSWRHCYQYMSTPKMPINKISDMERMDEWLQRESDRVSIEDQSRRSEENWNSY